MDIGGRNPMSADDQREQRPSPETLDRLERQHERARGGWMDASAKYEFEHEAVNALPDLIAAARDRDVLLAKVEAVRAMAEEWRRLANSETDPDEAEAASVAAESLLLALGGQP